MTMFHKLTHEIKTNFDVIFACWLWKKSLEMGFPLIISQLNITLQNTWFRRNSGRTSSESSMASVPSRTDIHTSNKSTAEQDSVPSSPDNVGFEKVSVSNGPEQRTGLKMNRNFPEPHSVDTKTALPIPESQTDAPSELLGTSFRS